MESLTTKEFLEKLKTGSLTPALMLVGKVKKSENESEILFAAKPDFSHWIKIPSAMIKSVIVLKNVTWMEEPCAVVKLFLQTPANPEAKVLFDLLAASNSDNKHCGNHEDAHGGEHHCMHGCDHSEQQTQHHCGCMNPMCRCHDQSMGGHCHCASHNHGCSCGCMGHGHYKAW